MFNTTPPWGYKDNIYKIIATYCKREHLLVGVIFAFFRDIASLAKISPLGK